MKRAIYYGQRDVRIEDAATEPLGATDVRVDVEACGICGTDLHEYTSGPHFIPADEPHPLTGATLPVPLGHEFSGTIVEAGTDVTRLEVSDPVAIHPVLSCGDCRYCDAGDYHRCPDIGFIGTAGVGGGFAESTVVPAANAVRVPDELDLEYAALGEPLMAATHAVRRSQLSVGDTVAVFGAGPIGLLVLQAARAAGARRVFVSEPQDARRAIADELGADAVVDPTDTDPVPRFRDLSDGGVDVSFEVAGVEASLESAVESTSHGGTITIVSIFEEAATIDPASLVTAERTVTTSFCAEAGPLAPYGELRTALGLLADGRVSPEPLITDRIALTDLVSGGLERLTAGDGDVVKVLVRP